MDCILSAAWPIAFVSGTSVINRSQFRGLKRDLKDIYTGLNELKKSLDEVEIGLKKLETDLDELNTDLNKLETLDRTLKRAFEDGVLTSEKDANAVESREVSAESKMQGRLVRAIINLKNSELNRENGLAGCSACVLGSEAMKSLSKQEGEHTTIPKALGH